MTTKQKLLQKLTIAMRINCVDCLWLDVLRSHFIGPVDFFLCSPEIMDQIETYLIGRKVSGHFGVLRWLSMKICLNFRLLNVNVALNVKLFPWIPNIHQHFFKNFKFYTKSSLINASQENFISKSFPFDWFKSVYIRFLNDKSKNGTEVKLFKLIDWIRHRAAFIRSLYLCSV